MKTTPGIILSALCVLGIMPPVVSGQSTGNPAPTQFVIEWPNLRSKGSIEVLNGVLSNAEIVRGKGTVSGSSFDITSTADVRLLASFSRVRLDPGSDPTIVTVRTGQNPFSFFLRDVSSEFPVWIPACNVVVTTPDDIRSYNQIESAIKARKGRTKLQEIEEEPEESFDSASSRTRNQPCPTWLGLSRDMRIFELGDNRSSPGSDMNTITPRNSWSAVTLPGFKEQELKYVCMVGRGQGVAVNTVRRLEDGVLPILHSTLTDGGVEYLSTAFVSPEKSHLSAGAPIGTDWLVADVHSGGHMLTREQQEIVKPGLEAEESKTETTVLYFRCEAVNHDAVPRYAWFKTIRPVLSPGRKAGIALDRESGFSSFPSGGVFGISRLNGRPLHDEEIAVLVKPGEKADFEFVVPHSPVSKERAAELSQQSFDARCDQCRQFWRGKLERAARISVPETRINEMIQAGLLQLDMITYGIEPGGTLAPTIGIYSPIGTESSPIIQFYNSMGLADIARRCLMFFLDKQHEDGMIQNFGGYMVETGAALWSMGEYYRYTRDTAWVRLVEPKLLKAADFLIRWREENKSAGLKGKGYGMIPGKVADPEDPYHQYMLNAYAYLGISRAAEMLMDVDNVQSIRVARESQAWKEDIRNSLMRSVAGSPVVPLGDGTWSPTVPPWTEAVGLRSLHISPDPFFSHGTVTVPDALLGPLYLVFCEVIAPEEPLSRMILDYQSELFYESNAAFSQPYYSRHDWVELKLGLVKPFLKTYYNSFSGLADRETYTFWEHVFQVSPHKTHEQAWFLMETRWMLYLEDQDTLRLLPGIPRAWMEDGKQITLTNVRSYFGPVSLRTEAHTRDGYIEATISCNSGNKPHDVVIRLPHPAGRRAIKVTGGLYDPASESVVIRGFNGTASVRAEF